MTPCQIRELLGQRLERRRGDRSIYSCDASGVGYQVIRRIERGGNETLSLDTCYLLASFYGCGLAGILDLERDEVGTWDPSGPSYPELDGAVRTTLRAIRHRSGLGTKLLSRAARVLDPRCHQSWLVRIEGGQIATLDLVRLATVMHCLDARLPDLIPT